jgi:hypothetical protein
MMKINYELEEEEKMRETQYVKNLGLVVIILLITSAPIMAEALSGPQKNAVRSAENYLRFKSFSRSGLIEQLSSEYGDSYKASDATLAVDSLGVDWNKQAVRAAEEYLRFSGFSCKGLTEQLSASTGDGYTQSQARYGAQRSSACE